MPGLFAAVIGVICAVFASSKVYGQSLGQVFPRMKPDSTGSAADAEEMAAYQLAALGTTLGIAIVGGLVTGICSMHSCALRHCM